VAHPSTARRIGRFLVSPVVWYVLKVWKALDFFNVWSELDRVAAERRLAATPRENRSDALLTAYVLCVVAISLVLQETFGTGQFFDTAVDFIDNPESSVLHPVLFALVGWIKPQSGLLRSWLYQTDYYELIVLCYWAAWRVFGFLILPAVAAVAHPRLRREPLGLSVKGMSSHLWIYGLLFIPVFIAVIIVSFFDEFQSYYPFYTRAHESFFRFAVWEAFYFAQFFSLEFFFRGFMIQPVRRHMGSSAIFAMMIPYVMIHISKPLLECFAAILAGVVLGTLSLRTRSVWSGFLIHVSVALSMDIASICQQWIV
jgi:membrane protease YdiL (CAAX protease family)